MASFLVHTHLKVFLLSLLSCRWLYSQAKYCRYWAADNTKERHQNAIFLKLLVAMWCGVSKAGIVGPYIFKEGGAEVTVNFERYALQYFCSTA